MTELSVVMAAGVDDYGNEIYRKNLPEPAVPTSQRDRAEYCLYTLHEALRNIDYEIIFVEWIGQNNGARVDWDFLQNHPRIRIITVPFEFANKICPERVFHETHAKNIGIRRTNSDMILSTNNDCLWLDEVPRSVLNIDNVMIANRPTVYHTVLNCERNIYKLKEFCANPDNIVHTADWNSNGDFTLMPKSL